MLTVTEPVLEQLDKAVTKANAAEDDNKCVRLVRGEESSLALKLQAPEEDDTTYEYEGRTVLAVPESCVEICADKTLDISQDGKLILS